MGSQIGEDSISARGPAINGGYGSALPLCIWPAAACLRRVGLALRCANTMDDGVSLPLSYEEVHRILDIKEIMVHQGSMLHFDGITARL